MSSKKKLLNFFDYNSDHLGLYRITYCLFFLVFGAPYYGHFTELPNLFYTPDFDNIAIIFSMFGYPSYMAMHLLGMLVCILLIILLFGYKTKRTSIILFIVLVCYKGIAYSYGKVIHDFMAVSIPLIMAFTSWGNSYSIDALKLNPVEKKHTTWPVTILVFILGFGMFVAGYPKILAGWLDTSTHAVQGYFLSNYFIAERQAFIADIAKGFTSDFLWESMDYAAVIWETTFLLAIFKRSIFRMYVAVAILFHTMNLLLLNIPFSFQIALYLLFMDWKGIARFIEKRKWHSRISKLLTLRAMLLVMGTYLLIFFVTPMFATEAADRWYIFSFLGTLYEELLIWTSALAIISVHGYYYLKQKKWQQVAQ